MKEGLSMKNYYNLSTIILLLFTGLISLDVFANELKSTSANASRHNVAANTYTRTYITVSTPRHGQGTFTTYHAPTFPSNDSKVRYTRKDRNQNQNLHRRIQTKSYNLEQQPNVIYYNSSPEHTGVNNYNYTPEQTYDRRVRYPSSPSFNTLLSATTCKQLSKN
jgi:hypothetical protein